MKSQIDQEEVVELLESALQAKYGESFDVSQLEFVRKKPRGQAERIGAVFDLSPKTKAILSAVGES